MGDISNFYGRISAIAEHFGWTSQCMKYIEEAAESLQEICHCCFNADLMHRQHLIEEIADVYIVLLQLPYLLDQLFSHPCYYDLPDGSRKQLTHEELFWKIVDLKIKRTEERIESGYYEKEHE